jgi:hypothetical protein
MSTAIVGMPGPSFADTRLAALSYWRRFPLRSPGIHPVVGCVVVGLLLLVVDALLVVLTVLATPAFLAIGGVDEFSALCMAVETTRVSIPIVVALNLAIVAVVGYCVVESKRK